MKTQITTQNAPQAIGVYSQAIRSGNTVYLSGQIPLNPNTMQLVGEDFATQTKQVFANLSEVAKAAGGDFSKIVKLTIYLIDLSNFSIVNDIMATYFAEPYPARATIQVSALPKGAQVEIDGIMVLS
jgi:reactive intermediate/imine deaminase